MRVVNEAGLATEGAEDEDEDDEDEDDEGAADRLPPLAASLKVEILRPRGGA